VVIVSFASVNPVSHIMSIFVVRASVVLQLVYVVCTHISKYHHLHRINLDLNLDSLDLLL